MFPVRPVPDNDVKKPSMYVFADMEDYKARGQNVDQEYQEYQEKKKKGAFPPEPPNPPKPIIDLEKLYQDHEWLIGRRLVHKLYGHGLINTISCSEDGQVFLAVIFEKETKGETERKLGYDICKRNNLISII